MSTDGGPTVDSWKRAFLDKLHEAQSRCAKEFEDTLDRAIVPVFDKLAAFLGDNGFKITTPLAEPGRRSFKYELAENAYVLMIFRLSGLADFELRSEILVPGENPVVEKSIGRLADVKKDWAQEQFQTRLDRFVGLLAGEKAGERGKELVTAV